LVHESVPLKPTWLVLLMWVNSHCYYDTIEVSRESSGSGIRLVTQWLLVQSPAAALSNSNLGQVVHTLTVYLGIGKSWGINRHTTQCINPVSVVSQHKLVSGRGLWKQRLKLPCGPKWLGKDIFYTIIALLQWNHIQC